jgi:hypothetical protein
MTNRLTYPSERFRENIEPALAEYLKNPLSKRSANNLARDLDHHSDWAFEYYKQNDRSRLNGATDVKTFRRQLYGQCPELRMMNDLSDASHHRFLNRRSNPQRIVTASTAAYSVKDGALYVPNYETHFLPAANTAVDFWRDWND